ncbi:MAG: hypothetical protein ACYC75_02370 [Minisyncoccota bacterium]
MANKNERSEIIKKMLSDRKLRRAVTRKSHDWFFSFFLGHYVDSPMALFHKEMFKLTEDQKTKLTVVMAFRGSGKSTVMNLSCVLWSILGTPQKKFVVIVSKTQSQAKNHLQNIRDELQRNELLKQDLGPFESDDTNWGMSSLVLPLMGARITAASREQSMRGIRFGQHRPDLIIVDDVEDFASVESKADRDATYEWLMNEVIPVGSNKTKVIVLGNLLHEDSLLMRLWKDILQKRMGGIFRSYPFLDDMGQVLWPGKYDTQEKIDALELSTPDEKTWNRDFLLRYIPERWFMALHEYSKACAEGKDPLEGHPIRMLGKYQISAPLMTFPEGRERRFLEGFAVEARSDPRILGRIRSLATTNVVFTRSEVRPDWTTGWVTLRSKESLKTIIRLALESNDDEARADAIKSIQELAVDYPEFKQMLRDVPAHIVAVAEQPKKECAEGIEKEQQLPANPVKYRVEVDWTTKPATFNYIGAALTPSACGGAPWPKV